MKLCIAINRRNGIPSFHVVDTAVTLGRSSRADIQISDKYISRTHLVLWGEVNNRCFVKDLGSENGTYVNGRQIPVRTDVEVRNGQSIIVGKSLIQICSKKAGLLFAFVQSGFPLSRQNSDHQLSFS
jgi:pSer/pThr/pTyr-binding forkhead associated (FHA) protein